MGMMFSNLADACTWLYAQGWRQNESGQWLKGGRLADLRRSPANDGVVCVVVRKACQPQMDMVKLTNRNIRKIAIIRRARNRHLFLRFVSSR